MTRYGTYASGEWPHVGDRVTLQGRKPAKEPGTVLEVSDDGHDVWVSWDAAGRSKSGYSASALVLVRPADGDVTASREVDVTRWENIAPAGSHAVSHGTVLHIRPWVGAPTEVVVCWENGSVLNLHWPEGETAPFAPGDSIRAIYQRAVRE